MYINWFNSLEYPKIVWLFFNFFNDLSVIVSSFIEQLNIKFLIWVFGFIKLKLIFLFIGLKELFKWVLIKGKGSLKLGIKNSSFSIGENISWISLFCCGPNSKFLFKSFFIFESLLSTLWLLTICLRVFLLFLNISIFFLFFFCFLIILFLTPV